MKRVKTLEPSQEAKFPMISIHFTSVESYVDVKCRREPLVLLATNKLHAPKEASICGLEVDTLQEQFCDVAGKFWVLLTRPSNRPYEAVSRDVSRAICLKVCLALAVKSR